ncbi:MAG TPA: zf-HC2 domain-containing protein [Bryobacteraceae bacterium]|nr:zf-HC2 domain-containing protein [Bryobacteraceae bacterium]
MEHEQAVQNLAVECYLMGEMTPGEREAFEQHYFECGVCAEDVRTASQFLEDMKGVLEDGRQPSAVPKPTREARGQRSPGWTWTAWLQPQFATALVAVLGIVAAVETFSTIPNLKQQVREVSAPRPVRSITLKPQTRGASTLLTVQPGEAALVTLDGLDLPPAAASRLQFVVKSNDGQDVLSFSGEYPGPDEPVIISFPKLDLPAGNYVLQVETLSTAGTARELGRYPFELKPQ